MCGVCGLLDNGPQWSDPLRQDIPLRQLRLRQLAFHSLDRLWKEAENMLHQAIDPLDDAWLASLEAKGENDAC